MKKFFQEFKDFAMRGNVMDMAIGVIIGGAFGAIVSSLVNDIIMPGVGVLTGGTNFNELKYVIQKGVTQGTEIITPEVSINYGTFIQTIIDFLIIAFCIFMVIKVMNKMKKAKEDEAAAPAGPTQEELLAEIRDLLKKDAEKTVGNK